MDFYISSQDFIFNLSAVKNLHNQHHTFSRPVLSYGDDGDGEISDEDLKNCGANFCQGDGAIVDVRNGWGDQGGFFEQKISDSIYLR